MILIAMHDQDRLTIARLFEAAALMSRNDQLYPDPPERQIPVMITLSNYCAYDMPEAPPAPRWTWREFLTMWRRAERSRQASAVSLTKRPFRQVGSERLKRRAAGGVFCWARHLRTFA